MQDTLTNINYDNVAALQQKRTLAFVNHFILTTVQFLNNFAKQCEQKFMHIENKLEKINATMVLLETRLSSIPELNTQEVVETRKEEANTEVESPPIELEEAPVTEEKPPEVEPVNPELMRFVKMVQVGVPVQAVKVKMTLEGFDPKDLDKLLKN